VPLSLIALEAVSSSETLVSIYQTTYSNIPEDSYLYTRRSKNLKSHFVNCASDVRVVWCELSLRRRGAWNMSEWEII
jgi:hypothetical protein